MVRFNEMLHAEESFFDLLDSISDDPLCYSSENNDTFTSNTLTDDEEI
jgi:hypothetical protein